MSGIELARQYARSTSAICKILKQRESKDAEKPAEGIMIISKNPISVHEEMERLLLACSILPYLLPIM